MTRLPDATWPRKLRDRADARNALLQGAELAGRAARGTVEPGWAHTDPLLLQTQGLMSAAAAAQIARLAPTLGLQERLARPGSAFLDVGAGVAAVSIELCRHFPALRAVGLEPAEAPRRLAAEAVRAAGLADRIELRDQRVEDVTDEAAFDLAWLPLSFLGPAAAEAGIRALHRALRPGGWLLTATLGSPAGGDLRDQLAALRTVLWGGEPLAPDAVVAMLQRAGFADPRAQPRRAAGLTPIAARRP